MSIKIKLHSKFEIYAVIEKNYRTMICKKINVFDACDVTKEEDNIEFIELLSCFASGLLELEKVYEQKYLVEKPIYFGYSAKIVQKNNKHYLRLDFYYNQNYYMILSKYDCKVIVSNFNKIYSKCTRSELL